MPMPMPDLSCPVQPSLIRTKQRWPASTPQLNSSPLHLHLSLPPSLFLNLNLTSLAIVIFNPRSLPPPSCTQPLSLGSSSHVTRLSAPEKSLCFFCRFHNIYQTP